MLILICDHLYFLRFNFYGKEARANEKHGTLL